MSSNHIASAVVSTTGEVLEYKIETPGEVSRAYRDVEAHLAAYREIKRLIMSTGMDILSKQEKQ